MKCWLRVSEAAKYCGVSIRTIRDWMKVEGLKYSKVRGTVLIQVHDLGGFLETYTVPCHGGVDIDSVVNEVLGK